MNLILHPPDIPGVWAASANGRCTVKRSPIPNDLDLWAYLVRLEDKSGGHVSVKVVREACEEHFLIRLAEWAGSPDARLYERRGDKTPLCVGRPRPGYKCKPKMHIVQSKRLRAVDMVPEIMQLYSEMDGGIVERCKLIGKKYGWAEATVRRHVSRELKARRAA